MMPVEKTNPTLLKKYIYEYSLITLAGCVVFLFFQLADMNNFIRVQLIEQKTEVTRTIEKTNATIDKNTEAIKTFNQMQRERK
jgi:hypothetical protein